MYGDKFSPAGGPLLAAQAKGQNVSVLLAVAESIKEAVPEPPTPLVCLLYRFAQLLVKWR